MITRYKFFILVTILLATGFFTISFFSYTIAVTQATKSLKEESLPLSSDNVYSEIQRDLLKPNLVSSLMANDTFVINWIENGEKDINEITNYLKAIQKKYNTSSSFLVSDLTRNYYYPEGILKQVNAKHPRDIWFFRVKNLVEEYESNIDLDMAANDSLTIFTNYRVVNKKGEFIAVTGVGLQTEQVSTLLEQYKQKFHHEIYFVNRENQIILKSKAFKKARSPQFLSIIKDKIQEYNQSNISSLEYKYKDENYHINLRYIDELDLYLVIEAKEKDFVGELEDTFFTNIIIFSVLIIVIMSLIIYYINSYQQKLEFFARFDKLTQIPNRNEFDEQFDTIFNSSRKSEQDISLILFDVDDFKDVNDTKGHLIGDKVLILVASIFKDTFRSSDVIARWGGEEFIGLLPHVSKKNAYDLAEKLRINIESNDEIRALIDRPLTISIGVVVKEKGDSKESFLTRADKNLYKAKNRGKNQTIM